MTAGLVAGLAALGCVLPALTAQAQTGDTVASTEDLSPIDQLAQDDPDARMLLEASELVYDYDDGTVAARGDVQIYYRGYTIEADSIDYNQGTQRVFARGTVKVTEPDGNELYADEVELTDDFREGFLQELTLVTPERARFVATSAERFEDNVTVFNRGVYTACEPCKENPERPPVWQIKAQRIIHNQEEKVVYYENASFELLGIPIAQVPYFQHPDPTVERQSGFLAPSVFSDSDLGVGARVPYFFALAPNYDLTVAATGFSKQGVMGDFQWRHRLASGTYSIEGAGIDQMDPEEFPAGAPGRRDFRGYLRANGLFEINEFWDWGFDGRIVSDETFLRKYDFSGEFEYRNEVFLTGQSERNWFDARVVDYESMLTTSSDGRALDEDGYLPVVHPVVDYNYIFAQPVLGGRLSFDANLLSLSRERPEFVSSLSAPMGAQACPGTAPEQTALYRSNPAQFRDRCDLAAPAGNTNRFVSQLSWEATFVDGIGQVITPFASLRADAYAYEVDDPYLAATGTPITRDYLPLQNDQFVRGMPTIGMEYRYPILVASDFGYQIFEPIAQIIVRPDEPHRMDFFNEDARSLVFDDTLLFQRDKFSGYDRIEGGTRANIGARYTMQFNNGASVGAVFGQSFHIAGENPFPRGTGLATDESDYVAAAYVSPFQNIEFASRVRFDESDFELKRHDLQARGTAGPLTATMTFSDIAAEPLLGYNLDRREILGSATLDITDNWRLFGSGRYEISGSQDGSDWIGHAIGIGYIDECIALAVAYERTYVRDFDIEPDERITFRLNLRTVVEGETSTSLRSDNETL